MKITIFVLIFVWYIVNINAETANLQTLSTIAENNLEKKTTTTAAPTTTTTAAPTTTTTAAPTTPTTPTTTTTTTTSTTTTAAPITTTTTKKPTPKPTPSKPEICKFIFTDNNNETCILVQMATQFNILYTTNDNKSANEIYNLPEKLSKVKSGSCGVNGTGIQYILIEWFDKNTTNSMNLTFHLNATEHKFALSNLNIEMSSSLFDNGNNETLKLYYVGNLFETPNDMSYHCTRNQIFNLTNSETSTLSGNITVSQVQLEAYHKANTAQFSTAKDCDAVDTSDIVPIAVGIALIVLVVVVFIAYIVGRYSQARGYVSM